MKTQVGTISRPLLSFPVLACNFASVPLLLILALPISQRAMGIESRSVQPASTIRPAVVISDNYEDGAQFIDKMCSSAEALDNYSSAYDMVVYKENQTVNESGVFSFKKPRLMRVEVEKGPKKGSVAILALDGKVHGHLGGALKFFRAALSPDSELVRAANGFPMVGTDFYSLAAYLKNMLKEADHSRVSKGPLQTSKGTTATYVLDMYTTKSGKDLLLKRIYTDPHTYLPLYWEDYIDGKLWSESSWHNLKTNIEFPDTFFKP
jgi:outer membrane lipoprotein-sorting protein